MHFGDTWEIIADDLCRISAAQDQMSGVGRHPDIFRIGPFDGPAHVFFALHRSPDMGMWRQSDSHFNRLPANRVEGVCKSLQLLFARTAGRALAHIHFPMVATERL